MSQNISVVLKNTTFEFLAGVATIVIQPTGSLETLQKTTASVGPGGVIKDIAVDALSGRMLIAITELHVRRRQDGQEFRVASILKFSELTQEDAALGAATVELAERLLLTLELLDRNNIPISGMECIILGAVPDSISLSGVTDERGECSFLVLPGHYSVRVGGDRYAPIDVASSDSGERRVVIRPDSSR